MSGHDDGPGARAAVRRAWLRWTEPSSAVTDLGDRRAARVLASLLLGFAAAGLVYVLAVTARRPTLHTSNLVALPAIAAFGVAYALARTRRTALAATIGALTPMAAAFWSGFSTAGGSVWVSFVVLGPLLGAFVLPARRLMLLSAVAVLGTSAILLNRGQMNVGQSGPAALMFVVIAGTLTVLLARSRTGAERAREEERRLTQSFYQMLFERAPMGIGVATRDGRLLVFNDAMMRPGGYTRADLARVRHVADLYYDPAQRDDVLARLGREGQVVGAEVQFTRRDGSPYDVSLSLMPVTYDGQPCVIAIAADLTEQRRVEAERTALADVIERSLNEIYLFDTQTLRFEFANDGARRNIGYSMEELRRLTPVDLKPAFTEAAFRARLQPLLDGREPLLVFETPHRRKDGSEYAAEVRLQLARRAGRTVCLAIILDVTARKAAEAEKDRLAAALATQEQRLRLAIDTANVAVFEMDTGLRYTWIHNPLLGLPAEAMVGRTDRDLFGDAGDGLMAFKRRALVTGQPAREEFTLRREGRDRSVELAVEPLRHGDAVVGLRGAAIDVTAARTLQAQLLQSQKLDSLGRLAGGIAHDFNNLLTVINGTAELAEQQTPAGDPLHAKIAQIHRAGLTAAALTRQLLAFSRKQILQPAVVNLNDTIASVEVILRRVIGEDVTLVVDAASDLANVRADPGHLEQVLMNLVVNARDAMPTGGAIHIRTRNAEIDALRAADLHYVAPGRHVVLSVQDFGSGMDEATRARVFEPFFTTKELGRGTGLGLSTVYGIVKQNGGSILVTSEPGQGSTFDVYLPAVSEPVRDERPAPSAAPDRGTETVLVVEDEEAIRLFVEEVLTAAGYRVLVAESGSEALDRLGAHPDVDLVLTDVVMPGMSGAELAGAVATRHPRVKVLYTSGFTHDTIARHGVLDEGTHFIAKPYSIDELARKVRAVLDAP
ncbi:MAG: PAS domain S-box protein [Acidobacteriota bacterium]